MEFCCSGHGSTSTPFKSDQGRGPCARISTLARFILPALLVLFLSGCETEQQSALQIGDSAPGFTLQDLEGNDISLADYKGSPVILRFFLTDCKFCRADTPVFNEYFSRYGSQGLRILYIDSLDTSTKVIAAFRDELDIPFPILVDSGGKTARDYKVRALPQTIILNPQHAIIAAILGGVSEEELNRTLAPYINSTGE
jgi:peroxiredoxin